MAKRGSGSNGGEGEEPTESSTATSTVGEGRMEPPASAAAGSTIVDRDATTKKDTGSSQHHPEPSSSSSNRPRSSTATTTMSLGSRTSSLTPFYLLQDDGAPTGSPLHLSSRPSRRAQFVVAGGVSTSRDLHHDMDDVDDHDHHDDLMSGGGNVDYDDHLEVDSQAGNSAFDGDSSTTDGIHVYSLSTTTQHQRRMSRKPSKLPTPVPSIHVPYHDSSSSNPSCCSCWSSCCLSYLEKWSGVVTNLYYKRFGLVSIALCSVALGIRTTDTVQQSKEALAIVNQLVHGLLVIFTVQLALEVTHCAFQLAALFPWASASAGTSTAGMPNSSVTASRRDGPSSPDTLSSRSRQHSRRKEIETSTAYPIQAKKSRWIHLRVGFLLLDAMVVALSWMYSDSVLVVRTFWLLKGLRRAPGISELRLLIHALAMAAPTLSALVAMLFVVLYVFSVLFCSFFGTLPYYDGLSTTSWTLFQLLTLDNWSEIAIHTNETYPHSWILMVVYLGVAVFVGMSLLVAIMTLAVSNAYHERLRQSLLPDPTMMRPAATAVVVADDFDVGLMKPSSPLIDASERTAATMLTDPFLLRGDSLAGLGGHDGATTAAASSSSLMSSRLMRLESKMDSMAVQLQQMARTQASMHEILQHLKVD